MPCPVCGERLVNFATRPPRFACGFYQAGRVLIPCGRGPGQATAVAAAPLPPRCSCDIPVLMTSGCQCGAFEQEQAGKAQ